MKDSYRKKGGVWLSSLAVFAMVISPAQNIFAEEQTAGENTLVINEVNSAPDDWVEVMNVGTETLDLSGYEIRDNSDDHRWQFAAGTTLAAGEKLLVEDVSIGLVYDDKSDTYISGEFQTAIGLGSGDEVRVYTKSGELADSYTWTAHAEYEGSQSAASYGRYPDGTGSFMLMPETPGADNTMFPSQIVINEVESNGDDTDWVEIYNKGTTAVDISGWYLLDNEPEKHAADVTPLAEGTLLQPGEFFVFDGNAQFSFGLGKEDKAAIYNKEGIIMAEYSWTAHADGVYARIPDGTGEFIDFATSTKGAANVVVSSVVLNEIQSNDTAGGPDWIELANPTAAALDISGIVIKDNDDTHGYTIPKGTMIPANGFLVITSDEFGFGLGKNDSVRLYEDDLLIGSTTWEEHTNPTWGLYPDVKGSEYRMTLEATPGTANKFAGIPDVIDWPGSAETSIFDKEPMFLSDSSGLDFFKGQLYAVDNGEGRFWILDVAKDGSMSFAPGFENGKRIRFQKDVDNASAAGPDTEGITVDSSGMVYVASERDNSAKKINYNSILMVDPKAEGNDLVALREWNLTESLPQVSANTGIEAVEWVSNAIMNGKLFDQNTKQAFDSSNYPKAIANGVFFVALEDNGHVYAYVLNNDSTFVQIADIDSQLGGAMSLDYDTYENKLWVAADNGFGCVSAQITFTGKEAVDITHVLPAAGVDTSRNYEGFAIAEADYTVNGNRPVYRFEDGVSSGALLIGSINCNYSTGGGDTGETEIPGETEKPGETETEKPGETETSESESESQTESQIESESESQSESQTESQTETKASSAAGKDDNTKSQPKTGDIAYGQAMTAFAAVVLSFICMGIICIRKRMRK